jgi:hypothetical protein
MHGCAALRHASRRLERNADGPATLIESHDDLARVRSESLDGMVRT